MNKQRLKAVAMSTVLSAGMLLVGTAQADQTLNSIIKVGQSKTNAAQASQKRIDKLASETSSLLQNFKQTNKEIDGLRVYNKQLEKQLANQLRVIKDLEASIDQVTVIERQIQPLIMRMIEALEQFVKLDVPFRLEERLERVQGLRDNLDRADISVAEKFRQVLEAYNIEAEYGRKVDSYTESLDIGGKQRDVEILMVGRVALMYQTADGKLSGAWDQRQRAWVELDAGYRSAIRNGIKIADKQASIDVMRVPVLAPEAAQ